MKLLSTLLFLLSLPGTIDRQRPFVFHHENVLGTSLELKVLAANSVTADAAEAAALVETDRLAAILSGYDSTSEFSRWMKTRGQVVPVSPDLFAVLDRFDRYRSLTHGALDPAAEAATRVWRVGEAARRLPTEGELDSAAAGMRGPHWSLDAAARTATHLSDTPLMLNSFTKSYIVGRAADAALASRGVNAVVVNIGGDLVVRGAWAEPVQIADPRDDAENAEPAARLNVRDRAVATSGNYRRGFRIGDRFYSHIIDPRTARPAGHILSSTVVAPNPSDAGALATAFSVLSPEESARVAASIPGAEYLLIESDGHQITSAGWSALELPRSRMALAFAAAPAPLPTPAPQAAAGMWDPSYQLAINLEVARPEGGRARRPYVAVWIEDKDKFPVRTIALWIGKQRWLPDLRAWYRDDRSRAAAEGKDITASVSSATRSPGKYTLKWDGNDNAGKPVKAGKYTVFIEAAREHGTYQVIRQEVDFNGTPKQIPLQGGTEISAASLDYAKKAN
jgi:thiamine biosynthesis lipoprotein ApbE